MYQRGCHLDAGAYPTRAQARAQNQREKRQLIDAGRAHGVLVYDGEEPIGWCQFGPAEELPLPGAERLDRRVPVLDADVEWRITCFVTAVRRRRRGVAGVAVQAALASIARRGGGLVEANPTTIPENADWRHARTVKLFEREGFATHSKPGTSYVVMRRIVEPRIASR